MVHVPTTDLPACLLGCWYPLVAAVEAGRAVEVRDLATQRPVLLVAPKAEGWSYCFLVGEALYAVWPVSKETALTVAARELRELERTMTLRTYSRARGGVVPA